MKQDSDVRVVKIIPVQNEFIDWLDNFITFGEETIARFSMEVKNEYLKIHDNGKKS